MRWHMWKRGDQPKPTAEPAVAVLLPQPLAAEVDDLLARGQQIEAIRLVRLRTGLGLLPAHRAVQLRGGADE